MAKSYATPIEPLADRVVVAPSREDETTLPSGIIIPDSAAKEKPATGVVVAVGPGRYDDGALVPMQVKTGDTVIFSKYGYDEVKIGGKEYYILSESSVLGVIKK